MSCRTKRAFNSGLGHRPGASRAQLRYQPQPYPSRPRRQADSATARPVSCWRAARQDPWHSPIRRHSSPAPRPGLSLPKGPFPPQKHCHPERSARHTPIILSAPAKGTKLRDQQQLPERYLRSDNNRGATGRAKQTAVGHLSAATCVAEAARKLLFLAHRNITRKWKGPLRYWAKIANQLAIRFDGRMPQ